jgi:hypothetical protein
VTLATVKCIELQKLIVGHIVKELLASQELLNFITDFTGKPPLYRILTQMNPAYNLILYTNQTS